MSAAEELRLAASLIHHDLAFGQEHGKPEFLAAVADWLDATANHADSTGGHCVCDDAALAVARAYRDTT